MAVGSGTGGRREVYSEDTKIEQKAPIIGDVLIAQADIIHADESLFHKDYNDALAFNEEPIRIQLTASSDANAPKAVPFWVNGKGIEAFLNGKWIELTYVPMDKSFITKRKYVEVLIRCKQDRVTTDFGKPGEENPINKVNRMTSSYQSFQILEDKNPRGVAWYQELRRRNF